jgi:hypothetical protein
VRECCLAGRDGSGEFGARTHRGQCSSLTWRRRSSSSISYCESQSVCQSVSWLQIAWKGVGEYVHALTRALPWAGVWPSVGRR